MNVVPIHQEILESSKEDTKPAKLQMVKTKAEVTKSTQILLVAQSGFTWGEKSKEIIRQLIPPAIGLLLLLAVWSLIAAQAQGLPGPVSTFKAAWCCLVTHFISTALTIRASAGTL